MAQGLGNDLQVEPRRLQSTRWTRIAALECRNEPWRGEERQWEHDGKWDGGWDEHG